MYSKAEPFKYDEHDETNGNRWRHELYTPIRTERLNYYVSNIVNFQHVFGMLLGFVSVVTTLCVPYIVKVRKIWTKETQRTLVYTHWRHSVAD